MLTWVTSFRLSTYKPCLFPVDPVVRLLIPRYLTSRFTAFPKPSLIACVCDMSMRSTCLTEMKKHSIWRDDATPKWSIDMLLLDPLLGLASAQYIRLDPRKDRKWSHKTRGTRTTYDLRKVPWFCKLYTLISITKSVYNIDCTTSSSKQPIGNETREDVSKDIHVKNRQYNLVGGQTDLISKWVLCTDFTELIEPGNWSPGCKTVFWGEILFLVDSHCAWCKKRCQTDVAFMIGKTPTLNITMLLFGIWLRLSLDVDYVVIRYSCLQICSIL